MGSCLLQRRAGRTPPLPLPPHGLVKKEPRAAPGRSVSFQAGTERAFTGKTVDGSSHDNKARGLYVGAVGGLPLFSSDTKFDSGAWARQRP